MEEISNFPRADSFEFKVDNDDDNFNQGDSNSSTMDIYACGDDMAKELDAAIQILLENDGCHISGNEDMCSDESSSDSCIYGESPSLAPDMSEVSVYAKRFGLKNSPDTDLSSETSSSLALHADFSAEFVSLNVSQSLPFNSGSPAKKLHSSKSLGNFEGNSGTRPVYKSVREADNIGATSTRAKSLDIASLRLEGKGNHSSIEQNKESDDSMAVKDIMKKWQKQAKMTSNHSPLLPPQDVAKVYLATSYRDLNGHSSGDTPHAAANSPALDAVDTYVKTKRHLSEGDLADGITLETGDRDSLVDMAVVSSPFSHDQQQHRSLSGDNRSNSNSPLMNGASAWTPASAEGGAKGGSDGDNESAAAAGADVKDAATHWLSREEGARLQREQELRDRARRALAHLGPEGFRRYVQQLQEAVAAGDGSVPRPEATPLTRYKSYRGVSIPLTAVSSGSSAAAGATQSNGPKELRSDVQWTPVQYEKFSRSIDFYPEAYPSFWVGEDSSRAEGAGVDTAAGAHQLGASAGSGAEVRGSEDQMPIQVGESDSASSSSLSSSSSTSSNPEAATALAPVPEKSTDTETEAVSVVDAPLVGQSNGQTSSASSSGDIEGDRGSSSSSSNLRPSSQTPSYYLAAGTAGVVGRDLGSSAKQKNSTSAANPTSGGGGGGGSMEAGLVEFKPSQMSREEAYLHWRRMEGNMANPIRKPTELKGGAAQSRYYGYEYDAQARAKSAAAVSASAANTTSATADSVADSASSSGGSGSGSGSGSSSGSGSGSSSVEHKSSAENSWNDSTSAADPSAAVPVSGTLPAAPAPTAVTAAAPPIVKGGLLSELSGTYPEKQAQWSNMLATYQSRKNSLVLSANAAPIAPGGAKPSQQQNSLTDAETKQASEPTLEEDSEPEAHRSQHPPESKINSGEHKSIDRDSLAKVSDQAGSAVRARPNNFDSEKMLEWESEPPGRSPIQSATSESAAMPTTVQPAALTSKSSHSHTSGDSLDDSVEVEWDSLRVYSPPVSPSHSSDSRYLMPISAGEDEVEVGTKKTKKLADDHRHKQEAAGGGIGDLSETKQQQEHPVKPEGVEFELDEQTEQQKALTDEKSQCSLS